MWEEQPWENCVGSLISLSCNILLKLLSSLRYKCNNRPSNDLQPFLCPVFAIQQPAGLPRSKCRSCAHGAVAILKHKSKCVRDGLNSMFICSNVNCKRQLVWLISLKGAIANYIILWGCRSHSNNPHLGRHIRCVKRCFYIRVQRNVRGSGSLPPAKLLRLLLSLEAFSLVKV